MKRFLVLISLTLMIATGCGQPSNGGSVDTTSATSVTEATVAPGDNMATTVVEPTTTTGDTTLPTSTTSDTTLPTAVVTDGTMPAEGTVGDTGYVLANDERFSTLASAVTTAGMLDAFRGAGPYTVFAPTNEAFAALPSDQLQALLADQAALSQLLQYHVSPGLLRSGDLDTMGTITTLNGKTFNVTMDGSDIVLDGRAKLLTKDIETTNGIIHQIDVVLVPST